MAFPTASLFGRYEARLEVGYVDNDPVATIVDQSGNSRDLSGAAGDPIFKTGIINGEPVFRFPTNSAKIRDSTPSSLGTSASICVVMSSGAAEAAVREWPFGATSGSTRIFAFQESGTGATGEWGTFVRSAAGDVQQKTTGVDTTGWTLLVLTWDGVTVNFYRDGTLVDSDALGGAAAFSTQSIGGGIVGAHFIGDVALAASWGKTLDATELADLEAYVAATYGIGGAGGVTVTPATIATTTTIPTPTVTGAATVTPAVIATTSAVPAPSAQGEALTTPALIATLSTLPAPTVVIGTTVTPAVITTISTLPTPTPLGEALVTVAVITTTSTIPTPIVSVDVEVAPDTILTVTALPAPAVSVAGAVVTPATIETFTHIFTPLVGLPALDLIARDYVQFQRIGTNLFLAHVRRGGRRGYTLDEGYERVSTVFAVDDRPESDASRIRAMISVSSVWTAHAGSSAATLKAEIDQALQTAGFRRPDGSSLA